MAIAIRAIVLLAVPFVVVSVPSQQSSGIYAAGAESQLLHPVSPLPAFAVESVKPSAPEEEGSGGGTSVDGYRAQRITVKELLAYAFGVGYDGEILKPPGWASHDRFDVAGKLDEEQTAAFAAISSNSREVQLRLMMQSLLEDRFHLRYHFETRELPVYRLQVVKDGLKCPSDPLSPSAIADPSRPLFRWSAAPAPPPPPPGWHPPSPQEQQRLQQNMHMHTKGWPFWLIVASLSHQPELEGKPVLDETGLAGPYECDLQWSREGSEGAGQDFFPAVKDQLGLKFQPSRGVIEVLVVDSIDRPSAN